MPFFSKIYSLKTVLGNALTNSVGVVKITIEDDLVTVSCFANKLTALTDGEYYINVFSQSGELLATEKQGKFFTKAIISFKCDRLNSEFAVTLTDSHNVVASTNIDYAKTFGQYDDEQIADEDYYLQEGFYEHKTDSDKDAILKESTAFRKEEKSSKVSTAKDGDVVFGQSQGEFYLKNCGKVLHHRLAPKLSTCIPNSTFYLMNEEKEWYFGIIKNDKKVEYVCYAVKANSLKSSAIIEYADFVPISLFSSKEGYYITYRDANTGEVLKK